VNNYPLKLAVRDRHKASVRALLELDLNAEGGGRFGMTLFEAVLHRDEGIVKLLLNSGVISARRKV